MSNLRKTENLAGTGKKEGLRVAFDRRVKLEFTKRRKTSVNTGEVSVSPAHEAGCDVKVCARHGGGSEKLDFGVEKWLEMPRDKRIITTMTGKAQFES